MVAVETEMDEGDCVVEVGEGGAMKEVGEGAEVSRTALAADETAVAGMVVASLGG